jgi:hypothetical protein
MESRFNVVLPSGVLETAKAPSPEVVLSRTINAATRDAKIRRDGTWFVREYEDDVYRVVSREGVVEITALR